MNIRACTDVRRGDFKWYEIRVGSPEPFGEVVLDIIHIKDDTTNSDYYEVHTASRTTRNGGFPYLYGTKKNQVQEIP